MGKHDDSVVGSMTLSQADRAKYLAAGLPLPIYTRRDMKATDPRSTIERFQYDAKIGSLVHKTLGLVVEKCLTLDADEWPAVLDDAVASVLAGAKALGRGDKARTRIATLSGQYLVHHLPPSNAVFLGTEVVAETGRVDLAWHLPEFGMWFDEIKTWRGAGELIDPTTRAQAYRYLDHGVDAFSDSFRGVRLLPLGHLYAARLITPSGAELPLSGLDFPTREVTAA